MKNLGDTRSSTPRWNRVATPERVRARAFSKWEPDGDCWISTYSVASHGYAQIGWSDGPGERYVVLAHRATWEHVNGPVPIGMTIDHLCKTKRCVNPAHLRILDNFENARRTSGHDWPLGQCKHGHGNDELHIQPNGKRMCRICRQRWNKTYNDKKLRAA